MSAYIVSKGVIDAIVQTTITEGFVPVENATEVGQGLWDENYKSVNYLYREATESPIYTFEPVRAHLDPEIVLAQVQCYDYQSCEHPEYADSLAQKLVNALIDRLSSRTIFVQPRPSGSVPWGIEDLIEAVAS